MASANQHPEVFEEYLSKELSLGRMLGPFPSSLNLLYLQVNWVGIIPKGHNTGKWRLITDLSFPPNQSVNDGIDPSLCSLSYITVEDVAAVVAHLGVGTLLVKVDIESAYRLVPVHPQDRPLQAMLWKDKLYIDPKLLPFGLRSAPQIFNAVADALNWQLRQSGIQHIFHYLDDVIFLVPPGAMELAEAWLGILHREQIGYSLGVSGPHNMPTVSKYRNRHGGQPAPPTRGEATAIVITTTGMERSQVMLQKRAGVVIGPEPCM